jgi:murein DD-endopeptidase MepM/ murein hydrolase activator NlpD
MTKLLHLGFASLSLAACFTGDEPIVLDDDEPVGPDQTRIVDEAVGVSMVVPTTMRVAPDPALFDTYGFFIQDAADPTHAHAHARVALAYQAKPDQLEQLVADKLAQYKDAGAKRVDLTLADGRKAVAVTNLPGTDPYTAVFMADGDRVYEVGLWGTEPGVIDDRGRGILDALRFREPSRDVASLELVPQEQALFLPPPADATAESEAALSRRRVMARRVIDSDPGFLAAASTEVTQAPVTNSPLALSCGFTAPSDLYWQLQWDDTNTFYSGTYYNLKNNPGWSAMSGNYGSWWGTNYHVGLCYTDRSNQYYANDWPAQHWANAYAAFSGYVEWAGWGTDGFATLGRYVVVRNGQYRNTTAHLSGIRNGVTWGAWIDGYWDLIGWAGDTGGPWDPHLHARVSWGESLTANGQPYGGQSVRPLRLRCFDCKDYDVAATGGGGYYKSFSHGRWMRY